MKAIVVKNTKDTTGCGMFSKVGRFSTEQHGIFLKKDDIFEGKNKVFKVFVKRKRSDDDSQDYSDEEAGYSKDRRRLCLCQLTN